MGDPEETGPDANEGDTEASEGNADRYDDLREDVSTIQEAVEGLREDVSTIQEAVEGLREDVAAVETAMEDRTVHREEFEGELKQYVRSRMRRGHARGWGPYLVLLYGTIMTIAAFSMLSGGWAILAMLVVWLSTLGLYVLMVLFGLAFTALSAPRRALDVTAAVTDTLRKLRP